MATVSEPTAGLFEIAPPHRFSTARYLEMIEMGVFGPPDRVELIGGVIVDMSPQGSRHNHFLMRLNGLFAPLWDRAIVAVQATVNISEGAVFDPDLVLLRKKPDGYKLAHPGPQDILLVVEAAESSLRRDQQIKLPVYAAAGIQEYWIADLDKESLIIHREPDGSDYRSVETRSGDEVISPLAAPELSLAVRQLFD